MPQAAIAYGFSHLGRFATAYKQAYGESPSETIARRAAARSDPANRRQPNARRRHSEPAAALIRGAAHDRALAA